MVEGNTGYTGDKGRYWYMTYYTSLKGEIF